MTNLFFTISTGQTAGATISSASSDSILINGDKTVTAKGTVNPGWDLSVDGGRLELDVLGSLVGPSHGLVGPASADGKYDNANSSLKGNGPHNPFLDGIVHWVINVPGVTSASSISAATFSFGTNTGDDVPGVKAAVPEPRGVVALIGVCGMGVLGACGELETVSSWKRCREPFLDHEGGNYVRMSGTMSSRQIPA